MYKKYEEYFVNIGKNIKYYRKKSSLSQEKLAELIHINRSYLSQIEVWNTKKSVSLNILFAIAEALEINPYQLLMPINKDNILDE